MVKDGVRHTREGVIERTRREFEALDALVRKLRPEDWARRAPRPPTRDPWTVKDVLAHIVYWKEHTARVFRGEKRPAEMRGLDVTQINRLVYEQWRDRSPDDVIRWHRDVQSTVMRALAEKPDEWFSRREHKSYWPGDFDGHSADHRVKDIEAALRRSDSQHS